MKHITLLVIGVALTGCATIPAPAPETASPAPIVAPEPTPTSLGLARADDYAPCLVEFIAEAMRASFFIGDCWR